MEQTQSKSSKEEQREKETCEQFEEEPSEEEEPIEEEPFEEEPIEEEPFEEEPIEEEPFEEQPIEQEPSEEEPTEEDEPIEEEPTEEDEPIEEEPFEEEEPIEEEPFEEEEPIEEEPFEEEEPTEEEPLKEEPKEERPLEVGSPPVNSRKKKCVRWDTNLIHIASDSLTESSVANPSILVQKAVDVTSLFVGSLPLSMDTSKLVELFQPFGPIANARVVIDKETCLSKGFGFVCFVNPSHATKALARMNGYKIGNHVISVKLKDVDDCNLLVGHLPPGVDACRLAKMFSPFGHVTNAVIKKGYGFVKFANAEDAAKAIANMDGYVVDGHPIHVRVYGTYPDPRPDPQCTTPASRELDMANLYVANLPKNLNTDGLIRLFTRFGSIEKATVVLDKITGLSRGYGLVKFADVANASKAMKDMNGYILEGKELYINIAGFGKQIDESNLYVGYLPLYINKNSLCNLFERFGPIVEAKVIMDEATGISKGYGFVRFADPTHATKAITRMNGLTIDEKALCVRVAGVVPERAANVNTQVATERLKQRDEANLFVANLPFSLETSGLVKLFERFGPVVQAKVAKDKVTGISKRVGFVRFSDASHAAEAIKGMNGSVVEGQVINVKIADPPGSHLANKPGSSVNWPMCPLISMPPYSVPPGYEPGLWGSMAAQTIPWGTYPGPWSYPNQVLASGQDQWVPGPNVLGTMPMQQIPWSSVPANGRGDMTQSGLNLSDVIPTSADLASFAGFTKLLEDSDSTLFGAL